MKKEYKCRICNKKFVRSSSLSSHKKTHKKDIVIKRGHLKLLVIIITIIALSFIIYKLYRNIVEEPEIKIIIHSPLNKTYHESNIIINVSIEGNVSWVSDSINKGPIIPECYSCFYYTLYRPDFIKGTNIIEVFANDSKGKNYRKEVVFNVENDNISY